MTSVIPSAQAAARSAILLNAQALALKNIERYPTDLHTFRIYGDVAVALAAVAMPPGMLQNDRRMQRRSSSTKYPHRTTQKLVPLKHAPLPSF